MTNDYSYDYVFIVYGLMYSDCISYQVRYLSSIQHRNLVTLLGYCQERDQQILVYEYIPNGSVSVHLYGSHLSTQTSVSSLSSLYFLFTNIYFQINFDYSVSCLIFCTLWWNLIFPSSELLPFHFSPPTNWSLFVIPIFLAFTWFQLQAN